MPTLIEIARAYILRGEAYSALQEHFTEGGFKDYTDGQKCMDRIKAIPPADVVERPRWIPVTERLPEDSRDVLVCDVFGDITLGYRHRVIIGGLKYPESWELCEDLDGAVTHWMPLPEPPEAAP